MQQKIQQALADSPLSNAILSALEEQEWWTRKCCRDGMLSLA